jgi:hypothetical protein
MGDGLRTGDLPGIDAKFSPTLRLPIGLRRRFVPRCVAIRSTPRTIPRFWLDC